MFSFIMTPKERVHSVFRLCAFPASPHAVPSEHFDARKAERRQHFSNN